MNNKLLSKKLNVLFSIVLILSMSLSSFADDAEILSPGVGGPIYKGSEEDTNAPTSSELTFHNTPNIQGGTSTLDTGTAYAISQIQVQTPGQQFVANQNTATPVTAPSSQTTAGSGTTVYGNNFQTTGLPILASNFSVKTINSTKAPVISAPTFALINATTKHIYATKDTNTKYPISGLTNLMTAYIATQYLKMDSVLTVNQSALRGIDKDAAIAALYAGDTITLKDALASMFVKGCVDSANVVAENVAGSIDQFVTQMNQTATSLGLTNTKFVDPSGINSNNESTAFDMAIIMAKVCENQELLNLLGLAEYKLPAAKKRGELILYSRNMQLSSNSSNYNADVSASRMGYTTKSKMCIASMMKYTNCHVVAVILKAEGTQFSDTKKVLEFGKIATTEDVSN